MSNRKSLLSLGLCALALVVVGCNSGQDQNNASNPPANGGENKSGTAGKKLKVGVVFDSGGLGDKSFNDSAYEGIKRAEKEFGIEVSPIESKSEKDYETNLTGLAEKGCEFIIAIGLNETVALNTVAPKYKDVKFAIVDGDVKAENVRSLKFKEEEGSMLAGYLAGLTSKSKKLGFVGGMEIDLIKKFYYGYCAGAKLAGKEVEVLPANYTGDWNNVDKAKAAAQLLFQSGADIVYAAAGRAGLGVIKAAKESGKLAIGVDSDQDYLEPGVILTSMVKRVDEAVYSTIKDIQENKFQAGEKIYDLAANGVGLSEMKYTKEKIGEETLKKVEELKAKISSGEMKAPATKEEYDAFLAKQGA